MAQRESLPKDYASGEFRETVHFLSAEPYTDSMSITRPQDIAAEDAAENSRVTRERAQRLVSQAQANQDDLPRQLRQAEGEARSARSELSRYAQGLRDLADAIESVPATEEQSTPFGTSPVDQLSGNLTVMAHELPPAIARVRSANAAYLKLKAKLRHGG